MPTRDKNLKNYHLLVVEKANELVATKDSPFWVRLTRIDRILTVN